MSAKIKIRNRKYLVMYYKNLVRSVPEIRIDLPKGQPESYLLVDNKLTSNFKGDRKSANLLLASFLKTYNDWILEAQYNKLDPLDYILEQEKKGKQSKDSLRITLNTPLDEVLNNWKDNVVRKMTGMKAPSSLNVYKSTASRLTRYCQQHPTKLKDFNADWMQKYLFYLSENQNFEYSLNYNSRENIKSVRGLKQTNPTLLISVSIIVKCLKELCKSNPELKFDFDEIKGLVSEFKTRGSNRENVVAMSDEQWQAFKDYESIVEKDRWVRRGEYSVYMLYRFCSQTGLRHVDATRLDSSCIKDGNIEMIAQKNKTKFIVPMNSDARRIFEMYGCDFKNKFPDIITTSSRLKNLLKRIPGFDKLEKKNNYVLNQRIEEQVPLWSIITFHSSRRNFLTMLIYNNPHILAADIQELMGWNDLGSISNYLQVARKRRGNNAVPLSISW